MAKFLNEDVYVEIDGHDLSDHGFNVDTPSTRERVDVSGFGGAREFLPGQKEDSIVLQFLQDFATGSVHDIIWTLYESKATFTVKIRPTSDAVSANNPELSGSAKVYEYNGLSGALNARSEFTATFLPADGSEFRWSDT